MVSCKDPVVLTEQRAVSLLSRSNPCNPRVKVLQRHCSKSKCYARFILLLPSTPVPQREREGPSTLNCTAKENGEIFELHSSQSSLWGGQTSQRTPVPRQIMHIAKMVMLPSKTHLKYHDPVLLVHVNALFIKMFHNASCLIVNPCLVINCIGVSPVRLASTTPAFPIDIHWHPLGIRQSV